jgi:hypothetical protein
MRVSAPGCGCIGCSFPLLMFAATIAGLAFLLG